MDWHDVTRWLSEPWQRMFMRHAFAAIVMVGVICGATGTFVALRGLAFMGDALSHAIFPGIAVAFVTGGDFLIGALVAAIIVSLGVGSISQHQRLSSDTAIGVIFVGMFALGIAIISRQTSYVRDLNSFLFGTILGVTSHDLTLTAIVGVVVLVTLLLFRRELTAIAFDRTFAASRGLHLWSYDQLFLILLALSIVISIQTVGNILLLAMLVTPPATARLLTDRLPVMMLLSSAVGALCGIVGLYISYWQNIPSGACVVLVVTAVFLVTWLFAPRSGVLTGLMASRPRPA